MSAACLVLHGYGGSPFEVEHIVQSLTRLGIHTHCPLLPGHGTCVEDFKKTQYTDWATYAEDALTQLQAKFAKVAVVGFSMGGALTLLLAEKYTIAGAAVLSTPVSTLWEMCVERRDPRLVLLPLIKHIRPYYPTRMSSGASREIAPVRGYEGIMCVPQFASLFKGIKEIRRNLPAITCPMLIVNDLFDRHVPPHNALTIAQSVRSADITLRLTHIQEKITSHHMITTHRETREYVTRKVTEFVVRVLAEA